MSKFLTELKIKGAGGKFFKVILLALFTIIPNLLNAASGPPAILAQPSGQSVQSGATVTFSVVADGTQPLAYRWMLNNNFISGANNSTLMLANVLFTNGGNYQVIVTNSEGVVTSQVAFLQIDAQLTFRILNLTTNGVAAFNEESLTGDPKGGLATTLSSVFVTGAGSSGYDTQTSRHALDNIANGQHISGTWDGLACNLHSGKLYSVANGSSPISYLDYSLSANSINSLLELNEATGQPTGTQISLSQSIPINDYGYVGIFSGYDRIVIQGGSGGYHIYDIALPSGQVRDLGSSGIPSHNYGNNWAYWGVAEYFNNTLYLDYIQSSVTVVRRKIPGTSTTTLASFSYLNGAASLAFSLAASRWYMIVPYSSQFSSYYSTLATGKGTFTTDPGYPLIITPPAAVKTYVTSNALFTVSAIGSQPLSYQWCVNGVPIPDATNATLLLTNVQTADAAYYSVQVCNPIGLTTSSQAQLDVVSWPRLVSISGARSVMQGTNTTLSLSWDGVPPVYFQWRLNGTNIDGATNGSLTLRNIQMSQAGMYSVILSNQYGVNTSGNIEVFVFAPADDTSVFQITSLQTNNFKVVETYDTLGYYEYGPIAASSNSIFISTYNYYDSVRANLDDLSGLAHISRYYYALLSNLRTERVYVLGTADGPPESSSLSTATRLWELDPQTGALTSSYIDLSQPINNLSGSSSVGFFSGYDRAIVLNGTRAYNISLPSGVVTDLGPMSTPSHPTSYGNTFWGVAERFGGLDYIVYARSSTVIARTRVPDGVTYNQFIFSNLSSYMNAITVSTRRGRWYFQHLYSSQFDNNSSTLGYATATFAIDSGLKVDHFDWAPIASPVLASTPFPVTVYAKNTSNGLIGNYTGTVYFSGTASPAGTNVSVWPTSISFTNGTWSGTMMVFQASTNIVLQADDHDGHSGKSAGFRVNPINDLGLFVTPAPSPVVVGQYLTYSIRVTNTGPSAATGVVVTNSFTAGNATFVSATASQGSCSNASGTVICNLGSVSNVVTISLVVQPPKTGIVISRTTLGRVEIDPDLANNTVNLVTPVVLPIIAIQDAQVTEGDSGTRLMTFNVTLNPPTNTTVTVNYATANGTAFSSGGYPDFVATNGMLTFPPNSTNQTITVSILGDGIYELDETFSVNLTAATNGYIGRAQGVGTILNDDPIPVLNISDATVVEGDSGTTNAVFTLTLSAMTGADVTVNYATSNGTATAGSDYVAKNSSVSFGSESPDLVRTISVTVNSDTTPEWDETFYLLLTGVTNAVATRTNASCTIVNDDGIGVVSTFEWSPLSSPQTQPINVTVTAKDFFGNTVTNFTNTVALTGLSTEGTNSLLGNLWYNNSYAGDWTLGYSFTPNRDLVVTHFRHCFGAKVSLWATNGTLLSSVTYDDVPGQWALTPLDQPLILTAGTTYRLAAYTAGLPYYWVVTNNYPTTFKDGVLVQGYEASGDRFPANTDTVHWWMVDLGYSVGVPVQPTNSGAFVAGVWSGAVIVPQTITNMLLQADDGAQHVGRSNPFSIDNDVHFTYARVNGSDLQIGFQGKPGAMYRLERNDRLSLSNWVSVIDFRIENSQELNLFDALQTNSAAQFYRVRLVPSP